jgi:hypothetical protein
LPLGYLRAFIIVMVVLHHSVLAYYAKGPAITKGMTLAPRWWEAFPVVDAAKWSGFTPFILFNDSYTMAVLFLVSGLFSWNSLKRKKPAAYLRHRLVRLGIPLLFMCLLSPGTYYLVYLQAGLHDGFWHEWFSLHDWPGGPAWFLAALLIFDLIAVLIYQLLPRGLERAGESIARIQTPSGMLLLLTLVSSILYVPALLRFGPYGAGLLFLPVSRVLHDLSYFLVGLALGSAAAGPGIIVAGGRLASRWLPLSVSTASAFALWQATIFLSHRLYNPALWNVAIGTAFCLSCAISTLTALAISLHFVTRSVPFWNSLLACSFGIYLIHYLVVSWIQFGLLSIAAPGWLKGAVTFVLAFSICWGVVRVARRSPAIAGII